MLRHVERERLLTCPRWHHRGSPTTSPSSLCTVTCPPYVATQVTVRCLTPAHLDFDERQLPQLATATSEESLLLALPMELIQRITIQFDDDDDAIFSTRLACKTLEAATFDRFADRFFKHHHYCIYYKRSLLRLQDLLESSSRLTTRIRHITFTSRFFASVRHKGMQLAPNQSDNDLESAQIAAMVVHARSEMETLHKQLLPDPQLIRRVLVVFMAKCPGAQCDLDLVRNVRHSVPVHADVLEVVSSLGTPLTFLAVDHNSFTLQLLGPAFGIVSMYRFT